MKSDHEPFNPYAPPEAPLEHASMIVSGDPVRDEALRRAHLDHEANIKSVGQLHLLAAILGGLGILGALSRSQGRFEGGALLAFTIALNAPLGYGLLRLQSWARWTEAVLIGLMLVTAGISVVYIALTAQVSIFEMLIGLAVLSLIPAVVLGMLLSRKGTVIFSPEYRAVMARTPHVRYRTSFVAVLLALLLVGFVAISSLILYWQR